MTVTNLSVSVIVMADRHPEDLPACLAHLADLQTAPAEIHVVSPPQTRQNGIEATTGEIIAFLDATSRVAPEWLDELLAPYQDHRVVGVGGRVLYGGEDGRDHRPTEIGRLLPNALLTTNFGADPQRPVEVDHLPSAQASFRRSALETIGGMPARYLDRSHREVTEASLRLRSSGGTLIFQPSAVVRAPTADHAPGRDTRRFRDGYFHDRDLMVMLVQAFGWRSPLVPRLVRTTVRGQQDQARRLFQQLWPGELDGVPQRLRGRPNPKLLAWIAAELSGLVAGFPAAAAATFQSRTRVRRRNSLPG